jgi:hypothetical protein
MYWSKVASRAIKCSRLLVTLGKEREASVVLQAVHVKTLKELEHIHPILREAFYVNMLTGNVHVNLAWIANSFPSLEFPSSRKSLVLKLAAALDLLLQAKGT